MRTTVEIPDLLARQAKYVALQRGTTLRDLITRGLQKEIEHPDEGVIDREALVEEARRFRARLGFVVDPKEIDEFKREGRA